MPDFLPVFREKFGKSIANGEIKQETFIKHLRLHIGTHTLEVGSSTDIMHISKKKLSAELEYFLRLGTSLASKSFFSYTTHLSIPF